MSGREGSQRERGAAARPAARPAALRGGAGMGMAPGGSSEERT